MTAPSAAKPKSHDEYLARTPLEHREALEKLRRQIRAAAPAAEECISYGLPAFALDGRAFIAFGAAKQHCSLYPMSERTVAEFADMLKDFGTSKGAIRFEPTAPLPVALVRKIVAARIAEARGKASVRGAKSKASATRGERKAKPSSGRELAEFLAALDPARRAAIDQVRQTIASAAPNAVEEIKWNAPSFRTSDHFATLNLRGRGAEERVWLILHAGAKRKGLRLADEIGDTPPWLEWLASDRAVAKFDGVEDARAKSAGLRKLVARWLEVIDA